MQSIQALAREILNSQKNLAERTRKQAQQGTSGSGDAGDEEDPAPLIQREEPGITMTKTMSTLPLWIALAAASPGRSPLPR